MYTDKKTNHLYQGDIFLKFEDDFFSTRDPEEIAYLVISYTCDIYLKKLNHICFTPIFKFEKIVSGLIDENKKKKERSKFENAIIDRIDQIINNNQPTSFFLSPNPIFDNQPVYSDLGQILYLEFEKKDKILNSRIKSLTNPWRERLGYKTGYLFNRVALPNIERDTTIQYFKSNELVKAFIKQYYPPECCE